MMICSLCIFITFFLKKGIDKMTENTLNCLGDWEFCLIREKCKFEEKCKNMIWQNGWWD